MKTIRLLYPDFLSGGLDEYYFGAQLLCLIVPPNDDQPLIRVPISAPNDEKKPVKGGIYARDEVEAGVKSALNLIERENPDKIITIGGNCIVSLAPFDYLHGKYGDTGIIWLDAHPDVSTPQDGYAYAHAMVLGTLLGQGDAGLRALMKNGAFEPQNLLYVGLQGLHDYQEGYLNKLGVKFKIQDKNFIPHAEIAAFCAKFKRVFIHLDIDVLDAAFFHSTYFANPELTGDGSGGGRMKMSELKEILRLINQSCDVSALSIAEYLPFDEFRLRETLEVMDIFK
nr:arginase family protein [uncultured Campylobacter sp.]